MVCTSLYMIWFLQVMLWFLQVNNFTINFSNCSFLHVMMVITLASWCIYSSLGDKVGSVDLIHNLHHQTQTAFYQAWSQRKQLSYCFCCRSSLHWSLFRLSATLVAPCPRCSLFCIWGEDILLATIVPVCLLWSLHVKSGNSAHSTILLATLPTHAHVANFFVMRWYCSLFWVYFFVWATVSTRMLHWKMPHPATFLNSLVFNFG